MPLPRSWLAVDEAEYAGRPDRDLQAVAGGDHRRGTLVDGVDDLGVVDPAQVDRGDRKIGVSKLALNHEQRHTFARHLHRVSVSQLVRREPASDPGPCGCAVELRERRPAPTAGLRSGRARRRAVRRLAASRAALATE